MKEKKVKSVHLDHSSKKIYVEKAEKVVNSAVRNCPRKRWDAMQPESYSELFVPPLFNKGAAVNIQFRLLRVLPK